MMFSLFLTSCMSSFSSSLPIFRIEFLCWWGFVLLRTALMRATTSSRLKGFVM